MKRSINFYSSVPTHAHAAAIILTIGYPLIATRVTGNLEIFLNQLKYPPVDDFQRRKK